MTCAIEDAGFEIRDCIQWLYGSGFPKSHDISKAIDKKLGAEREVVEVRKRSGNPVNTFGGGTLNHRPYQDRQREQYGHLVDIITAPATPEAKQWEGWGTALKPANEPIVLARKPLSEKTIAENVMKWGTGGLNIEGCRIPTEDNLNGGRYSDNKGEITCNVYSPAINKRSKSDYKQPTGRFPANIILDEEAAAMLDEQQEGASRFFYCAKASKKERNMGLEDIEPTTVDDGRNKPIDNPFLRGKTLRQNTHPTVKPVKLMEYLITLITPPNGIVLDPFLGSGTTALAALNLGRFFIGIELNEEYVEMARRRVASHTAQQELKFA
jgi:site-specific DNA-methyltransferase (adenine-specific)